MNVFLCSQFKHVFHVAWDSSTFSWTFLSPPLHQPFNSARRSRSNAVPKEIRSSWYCPLTCPYLGTCFWLFISVIECGAFSLSCVKFYGAHCVCLHPTRWCVNGSLVYEWPAGGQLRCLGPSSFVPFFLTSKANLTPLQWVTTYTESCFPHRRALIKSHRRLEKVSMGLPQQNSKCWKVMQAVCFGKRIVASQSEKGMLGNICVNLVTYKVPTLLASGQPTSAGPALKTRNLWEQLEWQKEPRLLNLVDLCILTAMQVFWPWARPLILWSSNSLS